MSMSAADVTLSAGWYASPGRKGRPAYVPVAWWSRIWISSHREQHDPTEVGQPEPARQSGVPIVIRLPAADGSIVRCREGEYAGECGGAWVCSSDSRFQGVGGPGGGPRQVLQVAADRGRVGGGPGRGEVAVWTDQGGGAAAPRRHGDDVDEVAVRA